MATSISLKGFVAQGSIEYKEINNQQMMEITLKTKFRGFGETGIMFNKISFWGKLKELAEQSIKEDSFLRIDGKINYCNLYSKKNGEPGFNFTVKAESFDVLEKPQSFNNGAQQRQGGGWGQQQPSPNQNYDEIPF